MPRIGNHRTSPLIVALICCFVLAIPVSRGWAQETVPDTVDWRGYFPLELSNEWHFHHIHEDISFGTIDEWAERWTVSATETVDAQLYFRIAIACDSIFTEPGLGSDPCSRRETSMLVRYDDDAANLMVHSDSPASERPLFHHDFRLDGAFGDTDEGTFGTYEYSGGAGQDYQISGMTATGRIKQVEVYSGVPGHLTFVHGVGLIESRFSEGSSGGETLHFAKVGGKEYGIRMSQFPANSGVGIVETHPEEGSTGVSQEGSVRFTFDRPIDPASLRFAVSEWVTVSDTTFSADSTTVEFAAIHDESWQDVTWVILRADGGDGETLDRLPVLRYTLAEEWGDGLVRGEVTLLIPVKRGAWYGNGLAALLEQRPQYDPDARGYTELETLAAAAVIEEEEDGRLSFEIDRVRPGIYFPTAMVDENFDGRIDQVSELWWDLQNQTQGDTLTTCAGCVAEIRIELGLSGGSAGQVDPGNRLNLAPAHPNPSNGAVEIQLTLDVPQRVVLAVYDVAGRRVATLVEGEILPADTHRITWSADNLASGLYIIRATTPQATSARAVVVVR